MCNKDEYIQLPPLKRDLDAASVLLLWEFVKLSDKARQEVFEDMEIVSNEEGALPDKYRTIEPEEIADYEEALRNLIRSLCVEASDVASWVFCKKYIDGWSLEQMLTEMPGAEKFIIVMDTLFEKNIKGKDNSEYPN